MAIKSEIAESVIFSHVLHLFTSILVIFANVNSDMKKFRVLKFLAILVVFVGLCDFHSTLASLCHNEVSQPNVSQDDETLIKGKFEKN